MVSNIFYFHPDPWGRLSTLINIFQMGWFNHQLVLEFSQKFWNTLIFCWGAFWQGKRALIGFEWPMRRRTESFLTTNRSRADGFLVERCLEYVDFYPKLPAIPDTTQDVFVDNEVLSIWGPFLKDEDDSRLVMFFYTVSGWRWRGGS